MRWQFCEVFLRREVVLTAEYLTLFVKVTILFAKMPILFKKYNALLKMIYSKLRPPRKLKQTFSELGGKSVMS
jgi:hypothetical protein